MIKDWKETLFVWDGIISFVEKEDEEDENGSDNTEAEDGTADASADEEEHISLRWQGTWVGCDSADATEVPTPKRGAFNEFVSSEHAFEVEGTLIKGMTSDTKEKIIGGDIASLHRVTMTGGAGYDLGEGNAKKKHKDDRHDIYFFSPTLRWMGNLRDQVENMVLAVGENEFGNFISVGWIRVGCRVTLARRYVDQGDERAGWGVHDLRKAAFDQIATMKEDGRVNIVIPPWQCTAMHANTGRKSKRQKIAEE